MIAIDVYCSLIVDRSCKPAEHELPSHLPDVGSRFYFCFLDLENSYLAVEVDGVIIGSSGKHSFCTTQVRILLWDWIDLPDSNPLPANNQRWFFCHSTPLRNVPLCFGSRKKAHTAVRQLPSVLPPLVNFPLQSQICCPRASPCAVFSWFNISIVYVFLSLWHVFSCPYETWENYN